MTSANPTVAAVQLAHGTTQTAAELDALLDAAVQPACARGAKLVVLPQYSVMMLMETDAVLAVCTGIAARYGIWLLPGSLIVPVGECLMQRAVLFTPNGDIAGRQGQTHPGRLDREWGTVPADSLAVFPTPCGTVGIIIGEDIRYPEVARILALQGADLLIHIAAEPAPFREEAWLASLWREVQANQTFGIAAYLVGEYAGRCFAGRSAVFAPVEMTDDHSGVLAQACTVNTQEMVVADLDFHTRQQVVARYPVAHFFNRGLYAHELPQVYRC